MGRDDLSGVLASLVERLQDLVERPDRDPAAGRVAVAVRVGDVLGQEAPHQPAALHVGQVLDGWGIVHPEGTSERSSCAAVSPDALRRISAR
ncbi:hypothetical protein [Aeromicrobium sp. UC242_57]|uniref:hypothetical protein n=1 Tax=Aeromicrobium sp. UC242_57 TaxID=3374624 RepID=UPI0037A2B1A1